MVIEMRIERVDDRTVRCFLSNEELEEYDIDYKDFVTRSERAKEIVQEIIEQATEEVGYKPPKFAFDLQIMMVPDEGLDRLVIDTSVHLNRVEPGEDGVPVPAGAVVTGECPGALADYMERELGISKERQVYHEAD